MDTREYFLREQEKALKAAKELNERAESEEEHSLVDAHMAKAAEFANEIDALDKKEERAKAIERMAGPHIEDNEKMAGPLSVGEAFVKSDGYQNAKAGGFGGTWSTGTIEIPDYFRKTTMDETASAGLLVPQVIPGIRPPVQLPLRIADLMPNNQATGPSLRFFVETSGTTDAADTVAENAQKPESDIVGDDVAVTIQKIATIMTVTDELLDDVTGIRDHINSRGTYFVQAKEDSQLINGNGTSPNINGFLDDLWNIPTGSALSLDADSALDAVLMAMTLIRVNGGAEPDAIVVHPLDYHALRVLKDTARQYYGGGPFTGAYGNGAIPGGGQLGSPDIWNLRTVISSSITQGTVLLGAFAAHAAVWRKGGLSVASTNSHSTDFVFNRTTIRFEERMALAVYRPTAFYIITALSGLIS